MADLAGKSFSLAEDRLLFRLLKQVNYSNLYQTNQKAN